MKAYKLQEDGMDTVDANICWDIWLMNVIMVSVPRFFVRLGVHKMRLMTNNPVKRVVLEAYGLEITENVAIETTPNPYNERYSVRRKNVWDIHFISISKLPFCFPISKKIAYFAAGKRNNI